MALRFDCPIHVGSVTHPHPYLDVQHFSCTLASHHPLVDSNSRCFSHGIPPRVWERILQHLIDTSARDAVCSSFANLVDPFFDECQVGAPICC